MKRAILMAVAACTAAMLSLDTDAGRLGGGKSVGAPRDVATQRQMTPPAHNAAPATPATPAGVPAPAAAAVKGPVATPPVAQPGWKRFIGPVAGIAAGLGIAALMSHMGLGEGFGNFIVILLLVVAAVVIVRMIMRRRASGASDTSGTAQPASQGLQYAGAGAQPGQFGSGSAGQFGSGSGSVGQFGTGSGSAGGFGSSQPAFGGTSGAPMMGGATATAAAAVEASGDRPYPPGFDPEPFLQQAKVNFARLQTAYDKGDTEALRDVMTPEMFAEITRDIAARGTHQATDIVRLNAEILEVVSDADHHWATVRFHGLTREDGIEAPQAFDEAWNLRKAADGSTGWELAGIQQLQ